MKKLNLFSVIIMVAGLITSSFVQGQSCDTLRNYDPSAPYYQFTSATGLILGHNEVDISGDTYQADAWAEPYTVSSATTRSEEHTSELQSRPHLVCSLLLEKKNRSPRRRTSTRVVPKMTTSAAGVRITKRPRPAPAAASRTRPFIPRCTCRLRPSAPCTSRC